MKPKHQTEGANQRRLRVGEAIRHALAGILPRAHFRDPDLLDASITITEVRVSPDLKNATAFVMPLAGQKTDAIVAALNRAAAYLRGEVAREVTLRHAPGIKFMADASMDYACHIENLLKQHAAKDEKKEP